MILSFIFFVPIATLATQAADWGPERSLKRWVENGTHCDPERRLKRSIEDGAEPLFSKEGYPLPGTIPVLNRKVFRANRASASEYPYMASIRRNSSHYLTAAVLTKSLVVTVAHPLFHVPNYELGVVAGETYSDRGTGVLTALLVLIHQNFDPWTLRNDLALLRVYEEFNFRQSLRPIPLTLWGRPNELDGSTAFVSGWGRCDLMPSNLCLPRGSAYYPDETQDPMLRSISFTMHEPESQCDEYVFKQSLTIFSDMLCQGEARAAELMAPCLAVPGAPLVVRGQLVGLQSWGFGCGFEDDLPLVYTDLRKYQEWLNYNLEAMKAISQADLQQLFEATKSFQFREIMYVTRAQMPPQHSHSDMMLEPIAVDRKLANLTGKLYDLRDFLGKRFHDQKKEIYRKMKIQIHDSTATPEPEPSTYKAPADDLDEDDSSTKTLDPSVASETTTEDNSDTDYYQALAAEAEG